MISDLLIRKLRKLKEDDSVSSYPHIKNILKNQDLPIPLYEHKPFKLVRYRKHNKTDDFFRNVEELSYRTDILNITSFGRANEPGQGFFYCNDNYNDSTGITEAVSVFRKNPDSKEEILTVGAWNVNETLRLGLILPASKHAGKNGEFDMAKEFYKKLGDDEHVEDLLRFKEFLALEFAEDIEKSNSNYKISCAFTNYIKETYPKIDGLIYTSVKAEQEGVNMVLWPEVVNEKVEFVAARKRVFKRIKGNTFVEIQTFDSKDYQKSTGKIIWE